MRNLNILKGLSIVAVVAFISIFTTGCIPPNGTVTPTNTFNVGLQSSREQFTLQDTTLLIDGDSIHFYINNFNFFDIVDYLIIGTNSNAYEYINIQSYSYETNTHQIDTTTLITDVNALNGGILINNAYNTHTWTPFVFTNNQYICLSILFRSDDKNPSLVNGLIKNKDQYIVFRKLKGSQYQYYWLRVRNNENNGSTNTIQIMNGRYQLNNITTGQ